MMNQSCGVSGMNLSGRGNAGRSATGCGPLGRSGRCYDRADHFPARSRCTRGSYDRGIYPFGRLPGNGSGCGCNSMGNGMFPGNNTGCGCNGNGGQNKPVHKPGINEPCGCENNTPDHITGTPCGCNGSHQKPNAGSSCGCKSNTSAYRGNLPDCGCNNDAGSSACRQLIEQIRAVDFALYEVILYLDVYPKSCEALESYHKLKAQSDSLHREYEAACGPLTAFGNESHGRWDWMSKPFPWEYCAD